jgi:hypothetical protein
MAVDFWRVLFKIANRKSIIQEWFSIKRELGNRTKEELFSNPPPANNYFYSFQVVPLYPDIDRFKYHPAPGLESSLNKEDIVFRINR